MVVATLCGSKAKAIYEARPLSMCLCKAESHYSSSSRKRVCTCVCMSVFSPLHEQTVHLPDCTEEKRRIKRGFCSLLGKRVGERALGWSSLTPAALGARRGQHTIAVGRTGTWPCATRKFLSLTCCSSVCVFSPIDTIICFVWSLRRVGSMCEEKSKVF